MARYAPSALREAQRSTRRAKMLHAAEDLIRESGTVSFSVGELARRAGSSVASLYNVIGTKPTLLYTLLNATMDTISMPPHFKANDLDPVDAAIATSEHVASIFTDDPTFMRPLYGYVLGVPDPVHLPAFMRRSLAYWLRGLAPVHQAGLLPRTVSLETFSRDHTLFFAGAVDQWVQYELDDDAFRLHVLRGAIMRLLITDDSSVRQDLEERLRSLEQGGSTKE